MQETLKEKKHFTTSSFVVNKKRTKTLLIFHKKVRRWMYAGGHLEDNETPDESVLRELKEETGIEATPISNLNKLDLSQSTEVQLTTPYCVLMMKIKESSKEDAHYHIDLVYLLEADDNSELNNEEDLDTKWFTLAELEETDTFESIKNIAREVLI